MSNEKDSRGKIKSHKEETVSRGKKRSPGKRKSLTAKQAVSLRKKKSVSHVEREYLLLKENF